MADYKTISKPAEGKVTEKMSRFLAFAFPVATAEEARQRIAETANRYHDARHCCWAYMIGADRQTWQLNDNGEPSGTAGKPILGQINSNNLTDILIVVVRYFGGIKLGTGGLIVAYKQAAADAIAQCTIVERLVEDTVHIRFEYPLMNDVMRIVKEEQPTVLSQTFEMDCEMSLRLRRSGIPRLCARLEKIQGLTFFEPEETPEEDDAIDDGVVIVEEE